MNALAALLFEQHPHAQILFEPESLAIRTANAAARALYGHGPSAFSGLRITDLWRPEERPAARLQLTQTDLANSELRCWRHRSAAGLDLEIDAHMQCVACDEETLYLATLQPRGVHAVPPVDEKRLKTERSAQTRTEEVAECFQMIFEWAPDALLALEPEAFGIVAASNAYLEATCTKREEIVGRPFFDAFPDNPSEPDADGSARLRTSLERVRAQGQADVMGVHRYSLRLPEDQGGGFVTRAWAPVNAPVLDAQGHIALIIHRIVDVTALVSKGALPLKEAIQGLDGDDAATRDLLLSVLDLQKSNDALQHKAVALRNAQRLVNMGIWTCDTASASFEVSDTLMHLLGETTALPIASFEAFLERVDPEDRPSRTDIQAQLVAVDCSLSCEYRMRKADGSIREIQEAAESLTTPTGRMLYGTLRDVTEERQARRRLEDVHQLLRLAGRSAHFGGWRYDVAQNRLQWGPETASVHELAESSTPPSVEEAIAYYVPEHRPRIRSAFEHCVADATPFDELLQLRSAKGRRIWVRAIGVAERTENGAVAAIHGSIQDVSELVNARQGYDALAHQLRSTLEHMGEGFFTLDRDWRLSFVNHAAAEMVADDANSLIGQDIRDVLPGLFSTTIGRRLSAAMHEGASDSLVDHYAPLDKWVEVRLHPTEEGLAVHVQDVTDDRMRQERLRLLEMAISRLNDVVIITEAESIDEPHGPKIIFANDAFERRTGYPVAEIIGRTPRLLQGPRTQRAALDQIRRAMKSWKSTRVELINYKRDGTPFWLELDLAPIADDDGNFTHWVSVERDITDRKQTENLAWLNAERFDLVTRATNDVIWDWDLEENSIWWNKGVQTVFGYAPEALEVGPESWKKLIHPEDRERVIAGIESVMFGSGNTWQDEYRFLCADGRVATVVDRGYVLRDTNGAALRMVGAMIDVSERRELDEQLRQSQKLEAVGQLTGGIAHDFNNLLTVILGNAEILSERLSGDETLQRLADLTATAAERGAELTNRLLAFARRQALQPQAVDCNRLLRNMELLLRRTLPESIAMHWTLADTLWRAEIDPSQLENALLNLVLNARDAMPEGGCLTVETANCVLDASYAEQHKDVVAGRYVTISVSDTGRGMDHAECAQAFEPFFTTKEFGKGSGLGLSMVYGFVKQSSGHVKIYSEPGEGTTVRLYLPEALSSHNASDAEDEEVAMQGGSEHILVVEDNPLVREHLSSQLTALGYRVSVAASGPEALDMLPTLGEPDLLFTDVVMPGGMDGRQLAAEVTRLRPDIRVLFTSGYTETAIEDHGRLDAGAQLLSKPYRRQELAAKVRAVLDGD